MVMAIASDRIVFAAWCAGVLCSICWGMER